ncbi:hypothetical protein [Roseovarius aquimarinus]|uniref:Uncharacterized protein n=1 Tax=Roseovarius aquimarinus TaxID=1229156 RepID=A0ABW7I2F4_9RHOB
MHMPTRRDWSQGCAEAHLEAMRRAPRADLPRLARSYDWGAHPGPVLGWIMAQRRIDLATALSVFLCGGPERFNYMPKRDVPGDHRAAARLLDNICLRINSGFYLPGDALDLADRPRLANWLVAQKADRAEGTSGRWVLDEEIVARVLSESAAPVPETQHQPAEPARPAGLAALFARLSARRLRRTAPERETKRA